MQQNSQIKVKNIIHKSNFCDQSDAYILVKETITVTGAGADAVARQADKKNRQVTFKNYVLYSD